MCYKACFHNGGHGRKKTDTLLYSHARIRTEKGRNPYENSRRKNKERRKRSKSEGQPDRLRNTNHRALKSADSANTGEKLQARKCREEKNHFLTSRRLFGNTINFKNQYLHPDKSKKHLLYPSSYTYSNPQIKDNLFYLKKKNFQ